MPGMPGMPLMSMPLMEGIGLVGEELIDGIGLGEDDGLTEGELGDIEPPLIPGMGEPEEPQAASVRASAAVTTATAAVRRRTGRREADMNDLPSR
ncbi:hypothetical protein GCM10009665_06890 [Kitasatospora nipponensis]|uniref:Uncharacterized protein n=1 Tax=Kitasatospora nipponensis TaxID=258049 RepID=A0ABN1VQ55_9ACTN